MLSLDRSNQPPRIVVGDEEGSASLARIALSHAAGERSLNGSVLAEGLTLDEKTSTQVLSGLSSMATEAALKVCEPGELVMGSLTEINDEDFAKVVDLADRYVNHLIEDPA